MGTKRVGWARIRSLINENANQMKFKNDEIVHVNNTATTLTAAQSGATVFWTHGSTHDITLPAAEVGMNFKIVIVAGSNHAQNIGANGTDTFYGKVLVVRAAGAADDKNSCQTVAKASAQDHIKLRDRGATLGGNTGDVIDLWCLDDGFWTVDARLSLTAGNPSGTAVILD
tara:strand:- start:35803 stop:36315 length:513 start_codon:yes stop_codon:yes gene_type:complete